MSARVRYRGTSAVDVRIDSAVIGLTTHADTQQGYLSATVRNVDVVRDALRAVHAVAWSQHPADDASVARDAWFSVFDDAVFLEAPAPDGRAWLRVRLARSLFARTHDVATGTTTVRLPWSLGRQLRRLSAARTTTLVVSPGGADPAIDGSILDDRPTFATAGACATAIRLAAVATPSPGSLPTQLHPSALVLPLAFAGATDDDAPVVVPADPPSRAVETVLAQGARLRALAPLLVHARRFASSVDGEVSVLGGDDVVATLAVAHGQALVADATPPGAAGVDADLREGGAFVDVDGVLRARSLSMPEPR